MCNIVAFVIDLKMSLKEYPHGEIWKATNNAYTIVSIICHWEVKVSNGLFQAKWENAIKQIVNSCFKVWGDKGLRCQI